MQIAEDYRRASDRKREASSWRGWKKNRTYVIRKGKVMMGGRWVKLLWPKGGEEINKNECYDKAKTKQKKSELTYLVSKLKKKKNVTGFKTSESVLWRQGQASFSVSSKLVEPT